MGRKASSTAATRAPVEQLRSDQDVPLENEGSHDDPESLLISEKDVSGLVINVLMGRSLFVV